jgi:hypothetical protein
VDVLAQAQEALGSTGVDWQGITGLVIALGGIVTAVLQALGKKKAALKAEEAARQTVAVVRGLENVNKVVDEDDREARRELVTTLKDTLGVELTEHQIGAMTNAYQKHVKKQVKKTAMAMNVEDMLRDVVKATTRMDPSELRKRLEKEEA